MTRDQNPGKPTPSSGGRQDSARTGVTITKDSPQARRVKERVERMSNRKGRPLTFGELALALPPGSRYSRWGNEDLE